MSEPVFVPPTTPRSPRFFAYAGSTGVAGLLAGTIFTAVGLLVATIFLLVGGPFWDDWALDSRGVRATASPVKAHETGSRVNRRPVWKVTLEYRDAEGTTRSGAIRTTDPGIVDAARERREIAIRYLPGRWDVVRVEGTKRSLFGPFVLIPLAFALAGLAVLLVSARGIVARRRLYVWGVTTTGRVVTVTRTNMKVNNRDVLRIAYSFHGPLGPVEGSMTHVSAPDEGSEVTVLYDMNDPARSTLALPGAFR